MTKKCKCVLIRKNKNMMKICMNYILKILPVLRSPCTWWTLLNTLSNMFSTTILLKLVHDLKKVDYCLPNKLLKIQQETNHWTIKFLTINDFRKKKYQSKKKKKKKKVGLEQSSKHFDLSSAKLSMFLQWPVQQHKQQHFT